MIRIGIEVGSKSFRKKNILPEKTQEEILEEILSEMGRVLFKRTGDKTGTFIRLDPNDSTKYFDGSPAMLDGTEGDVMVYMPEFYYKYKSEGFVLSLYDLSRSKKGNDWIHVPASLIGAYKGSNTDGKLYSASGKTPLNSANWNTYNSYAIARGTGYQLIDYNQHCQIAMLFYAKYKKRNSQSVLGTGSANRNTLTGTTNGLGNNDTKGVIEDWVSFQGIEGVFGGIYEAMSGASIDNRVWTITNFDGTIRNVTAGNTDGYISAMALEVGPYFDMIPTEARGNAKTDYCDYYYQMSDGKVAERSGADTNDGSGIATISASYDAKFAFANLGTRLAFRGNLIESNGVTTYKSIEASEN